MRLVSDDPRLSHAGPFRKFYLTKQFGEQLRQAGYKPREMSCAELEAAILRVVFDQ
jgi:hypothetical protein